MTDSDVLYLAVRGRTPQQNSEQDFVAVEDGEQEGSMRLEINQPLSYEETPQYTILLRASVSILTLVHHPHQSLRKNLHLSAPYCSEPP